MKRRNVAAGRRRPDATLAGIAVAAALLALACSSSDDAEHERSWVEDALRYVPDRAEYLAADVYVANYGQLAPKLGPEDGACLGSGVEQPLSEAGRDEDGLDSSMYLLAPPSAPLFRYYPPPPRTLIGFDDCDLGWLLSVVGVEIRTDFAAYGLTIDVSGVRSALESLGLTSSSVTSIDWFDNEGHSSEPPDAVDLRRAGLYHVGIAPGVVLSARTDSTLFNVAATTQDVDRSLLARADVSSIARALGEVDALYLLPWRSTWPGDPWGWTSRRAQFRARDMSDPRLSVWLSEWRTLAQPERVAIAYQRDDGGRDLMKVALYYRSASTARSAQTELRTRLETYGDLLFGEDELCDSVDVARPEEGDGRVVVGTCAGGWAWQWRFFVTADVGYLLAESAPGLVGSPAEGLP